jgi:hypothetical protein
MVDQNGCLPPPIGIEKLHSTAEQQCSHTALHSTADLPASQEEARLRASTLLLWHHPLFMSLKYQTKELNFLKDNKRICVALSNEEKTTQEILSRFPSWEKFLELRDFCAGNFYRHFSFKWKFFLKE